MFWAIKFNRTTKVKTIFYFLNEYNLNVLDYFYIHIKCVYKVIIITGFLYGHRIPLKEKKQFKVNINSI